jgi:multiple antibiotic resistance protein
LASFPVTGCGIIPPVKFNAQLIIGNILYFLALINPASKIFLLCALEPRPPRLELQRLATKATTVAFIILFLVAAAGAPLLRHVFHVELFSLKVAGGVILFVVGLSAVQRGRFHESGLRGQPGDLSIVPLGAPLIAGPGTITAAISFSTEHGLAICLLALAMALLLNYGIMLLAVPIGQCLERFHATGPLVRITGLIVAAVAVQIIFDGLHDWLAARLVPAFK